jgi:hypothetical protein
MGPKPGALDKQFVPGLRDFLRYVEHVPSDQEITRRNSCVVSWCVFIFVTK